MDLITAQCPYQDIQQHLLVGGKVNSRLKIEKLGSYLLYMEHYTISKMQTDCTYLEKKEEDV